MDRRTILFAYLRKKHEDFFDQPHLPYTYTVVDSDNKHHKPTPDSSSDYLGNELLFFHCFESTAWNFAPETWKFCTFVITMWTFFVDTMLMIFRTKLRNSFSIDNSWIMAQSRRIKCECYRQICFWSILLLGNWWTRYLTPNYLPNQINVLYETIVIV